MDSATTSRLNQVQRVAVIKQQAPLEDRGTAVRAMPTLIHLAPQLTLVEEADLGSQDGVEQESCALQAGTMEMDTTEVDFIFPGTEHDAEQGSAHEGRKRRRGRHKLVPLKKQQCADSPRASESEGDAALASSQENCGVGATTDAGIVLPPPKRVRRLSARQKSSLEQAQELGQEEVGGRSTRKKLPVQWNVEEVADFIDSIDSSCTYLFREHVSLPNYAE